MAAHHYQASGSSSQSVSRAVFSQLPRVFTVDTEPQDGAHPSPNTTMEATNAAKEPTGITQDKAAFNSVSALLTTIRDPMIKQDYIELESSCTDICKALERGINERRSNELSEPVLEAIEQLTTTVAEIQKKVVKQGKRNAASRFIYVKNDKKSIATWRVDLNRILNVFNTELAINTHIMVADIHRNALTGQAGTDSQHRSTQARSTTSNTMESTVSLSHSIHPGELPPLPQGACFGRDELIEEIVGLVGSLTPIALIGAGGIGKTSIALTVLHHDHIKKRFGDNRRFIRCDQFPASRPNFLGRLSKVIGAGIENPEDLTSLRPFLSSREMIIFLDNAESILDPQGTDAREIYKVAEELSRFSNICLGITSRIRTVPLRCKHLIIPTLSMESACDIFYGIYDNGGRSDIISDLVKRLDFHALSITLLAAVALRNTWDYTRLASEWDAGRTQVLRTDYNESLATTIELSLTSPTFYELGPSARDLLGVVAFFPQGIDENLDWLFPTIPDKRSILDKFCLLSLTYRSNGFITMLAPLRDYLSPKSPEFSPLLHTTKNHYFRKLSVDVDPGQPGFEEARWIVSEDVNVEHLLDVFTSADTNSDEAWLVCGRFMRHLFWHKKRLVVLGPKIEGLPDNHPSKPKSLFELSRLFKSVGNRAENKRLLIHTLKLWRKRGNNFEAAETLRFLSDANLWLGLYKEGILQAKEALEIYERRNNILGQAQSLEHLAWLLNDDKQLDAAETTVSRAIDLFSSINDQFEICQSHRLLGDICRSKAKTEEAINHFETALGIASSSDWDDQLSWIHYSLALLFSDQSRFDDAHVHIERAKSHVVNNLYYLGRAMHLQALVWYKQQRFKEAESEALRAADVFERLGAAKDLEDCRVLLWNIEKETKS